MGFISLGKIDKNLISIVIGCIFCYLNRLLNKYEGTLLFKNVILTNIFISFSVFLAGIPCIILNMRSKGVKSIDIDKINTTITKSFLENNYKGKKEEIIKGKNRYIILSSVLYCIQAFFFITTIKIKANCWIWYILITSIINILIFKVKLYKHHYLSVVIIILIEIIIDLFLGNLQNDIRNNLLFLLLRFLREILLSLHFVLVKYKKEKKFASVYEMSLFNGIINLIILGIFSILDYFFFGIDNYKEYFNNFNTKELFVILGVMITQLSLNLSLLFTIKNNSSFHVFIIFVFGQMAYINYTINSIIIIICLIFVLFLSLIFNEIIEINFWDLSYNTKINIIKRAELEKGNIMDDDNSSYIEKGDYLIELSNEQNLN